LGHLLNGQWISEKPSLAKRKFKRDSSAFVWDDAVAYGGEKTENKYILIAAKSCPWSHHTILVRNILGLESEFTLIEIDPVVAENGWTLKNSLDVDSATQYNFLYQLYVKSKPDFSGRVTTPVLWDVNEKQIVSNDSSNIAMGFIDVARGNGYVAQDLYPNELVEKISQLDKHLYKTLTNKAYEIGFSADQNQYDLNISIFFDAFDAIENQLAESKFLLGNHLTIVDLRLFTFLIRFDDVYYQHFKCSVKLVREMPNIKRYLQRLFVIPGVRETVDIDEIKKHYFKSHPHINPSGILPKTSCLDWIFEENELACVS